MTDYLDTVRSQPDHLRVDPAPINNPDGLAARAELPGRAVQARAEQGAGSQSSSNAQPSYAELRRQAEQARVREGIKPYTHGQRIGYGLLWALWTVVLAMAALTAFGKGSVFPGLIALALAYFAGRYDYRIWTWQARRLIFFIVW